MVGQISQNFVGAISEIGLYKIGDMGSYTLLAPRLFKARCVLWDRHLQRWQGYERVGDQDDPNALHIKQEWLIELSVPAPERGPTGFHNLG